MGGAAQNSSNVRLISLSVFPRLRPKKLETSLFTGRQFIWFEAALEISYFGDENKLVRLFGKMLFSSTLSS